MRWKQPAAEPVLTWLLCWRWPATPQRKRERDGEREGWGWAVFTGNNSATCVGRKVCSFVASIRVQVGITGVCRLPASLLLTDSRTGASVTWRDSDTFSTEWPQIYTTKHTHTHTRTRNTWSTCVRGAAVTYEGIWAGVGSWQAAFRTV